MSKRHIITVTILAACGAAVAGTWAGRYFSMASSNLARQPEPLQFLVIPDGRDSFGDVWETKDFVWSFPVLNRGDQTVVVEKLTGSCTCFSVSPEKFTIEPGRIQIIKAHIDFTAKRREDENAAFAVTYWTSDTSGEPKRSGDWLVTGKVRPFLLLDVPFDFGRHTILHQPLEPLSAVVRFGTALEDVAVISSSANLRAEITRETADKYRLFVRPVASFPVEEINVSVQLKVITVSGMTRIEAIPVTGQIVPDVEISPPAYPGGGHLVGEAFEFDATISSISRKPFSIVSVKAIGDGLTVTEREGRYVIRQQCVAEGEKSGRVEFEIKGADGQYTKSLPVDYTGFRR